jgi:TRAP-type uncharacterized transport system fused permease subunit
MSWCAYLIPFLFAYSPALIMRGDALSILSAVALALLGIFMGTMAVVGYFFAPIPAYVRVGYAAIALMLLAQPAMFDGAIYANVIGVLAAVAAIAWEVARRRKPAHAAG